ncbi:uncharacterized protein LOC124282737 [Haliotis rubra]|uniref:uncharacterized protein LOC124282737 n=1 Tax=Haliotis rubra TaxID=36100 RepID=UPI001EE54FF3|nr:uncharacterized protein LOC124282737 [Haliotis rubra]
MRTITQVQVLVVLSTHSVWAMAAISQRNQPVQDQVKTQAPLSQSASSSLNAYAAHVQEHRSSYMKSAMTSENREDHVQDSDVMSEEPNSHDGRRPKRASVLAAAIPVVGEFFRNIFQGSSNTPDCMTEAQLERKFYEYQQALTSGAKEIQGLPAILMFIGVRILYMVLGLQMSF